MPAANTGLTLGTNVEPAPDTDTKGTPDTTTGPMLAANMEPTPGMAPEPMPGTTMARDRVPEARRWPSSVHTEGK